MKLYSINWEFEQFDRECEWTHVVLAEYPSPQDTIKIINDFMQDYHDESPEDFGISEYWINTIEMIDGYRIRVEKV